MIKAPPTIENLLDINETINRRIYPTFQISKSGKKRKAIICDAYGKKIEATPVLTPQLIILSDHPHSFQDLKKQFIVNSDKENYLLSFDQMRFVLGVNFPQGPMYKHIQAMNEAMHSGSSLANAYTLGAFSQSSDYKPGIVIVPVQYYTISKENHEKMALKNQKKLLKQLTKEYGNEF